MFRLATFKGSTSPFCFANRLLVTLPRKLIATFTPLLRTRGEDYVRGGRVEVTSTSPSLVEARVRGTALYTVHIRAVAGLPLALSPDGVVGLAMLIGAILALAVSMIARRLLGGYTGDVLGAIEQVFELGFVLGVAASLGVANTVSRN